MSSSAGEIRQAQRRTWAGLSSGWETWDAVIMDQMRPITDALLAHLDLAADQVHLDVAAGTGEPGLTIAARTPQGRVVLADLAPEMLRVAERRAAARSVSNIETVVCSADGLPFDDETFDTVSVRFGFMFFPDLPAATAEIARVLKPGGRLVSSVWVRPQDNPWTEIAMAAIRAEVALPPTPPDGPSMFRCARPGYVSALYGAAGFGDITEWEVGVELVTATAAEHWELISAHVSLAVAALRQVDEQARERIAAAVVAAVGHFEQDGAVRVPGVALCIAGSKTAPGA